MRKGMVCAQMMTLCLLLSACGGGTGAGGDDQLALDIRTEYIGMAGCAARMEMTADYGRRVYDYTLDYHYQKDGESVLTVAAPEEIAGITARFTGDSAVLEYDGASLETGPLDSEGLSPVGAAPALLEYARKGFIAECGTETVEETQCLRVCYRDPEKQPGTGTECLLWFDKATHDLVRGEVLSDGRRVIACRVTSFAMTDPAA